MARDALIHGTDDRKEHFEVEEPLLRSIVERSLVALMPRPVVTPALVGLEQRAPDWGERAELCPGQRFAEQPSAAFCTGVLVDWDLVLAAGHCAHVLSVADYVAVFGYYYRAPGELAVEDGGVYDLFEVVHERLGGQGDVPRLDHAWLRLREPVLRPFEPAAVHVALPALESGDPVTVVSTVGGVPLKIDQGGLVRDPRHAVLDYFVADTDTSEGSSGGGAFDPGGGLLGVLVRGGTDYTLTPDGCYVMVNEDDPAAAEEQYSYAARAVEELCSDDPTATSLCRADCERPCRAEAQAKRRSTPERRAGCVLGSTRRPVEGSSAALVAVLLVAGIGARRRARGPCTRFKFLWRPS